MVLAICHNTNDKDDYVGIILTHMIQDVNNRLAKFNHVDKISIPTKNDKKSILAEAHRLVNYHFIWNNEPEFTAWLETENI